MGIRFSSFFHARLTLKTHINWPLSGLILITDKCRSEDQQGVLLVSPNVVVHRTFLLFPSVFQQCSNNSTMLQIFSRGIFNKATHFSKENLNFKISEKRISFSCQPKMDLQSRVRLRHSRFTKWPQFIWKFSRVRLFEVV